MDIEKVLEAIDTVIEAHITLHIEYSTEFLKTSEVERVVCYCDDDETFDAVPGEAKLIEDEPFNPKGKSKWLEKYKGNIVFRRCVPRYPKKEAA